MNFKNYHLYFSTISTGILIAISAFTVLAQSTSAEDSLIVINLPIIEVKANSTEELMTLEKLAEESGKSFSEILYIDRMLDKLQKEYDCIFK